MGAGVGSFLGVVIGLLSVIVGLSAGPYPAALGLNVFAYAYLGYLLVMIYQLKPHESHFFSAALGPLLRPVFERYHVFIRWPGAATLYCGLLNLLRLSLVVWAVIAAWQGFYIIAVASAAFTVVAGRYVVRLNPPAYLSAAAVAKGSADAKTELYDLRRVQSLYEEVCAASG